MTEHGVLVLLGIAIGAGSVFLGMGIAYAWVRWLS